MLSESGALEDYARTELIDGVIVAVNAQHIPHARAKFELAVRLRFALQDLGSNFEVFVEGGVRLDKYNVPVPDVCIVEPLTVRDGPIPGTAMLLAVEVSASTLSHDLKKKGPIYARNGVAEYWVFDLKKKRIHRFSAPGEQGYAETEQLPFGTPISPLAIPDLVIETDRLV